MISEQDKELISSLVIKIHNARQHDERIDVISRDDLSKHLNEGEIEIIDRVFAIDPAIYGFKGPKLKLEPVPDDLVRIAPQPYMYRGKNRLTNVQFIPRNTFKAFSAMAEAMKVETGRKLLIESSYRSNSFQAITFLSILKLYDFDVAKTAKRAAIPGYSEHGTPSQLAFDVQNIEGFPSNETPQDFESTEEYNWLVANAGKFNFYMSYPKDNPYGLMFEPWHWRFKPIEIDVSAVTD